MDPFSAIIAIALIIQLLKKGPEVVADMAEAAKNAWDNAAHQARIKKLAAAGVAPASRGGAFGRYVGNLVRVARLDAEARHAAKAAVRVAAGKQPSRFGQRVAAAAAAWRGRNTAPVVGVDGDTSGTWRTPDPAPAAPDVVDAGTATVGPSTTRTFTVPTDEVDEPPRPPIHATASIGPSVPDDGGAGRVLVGAVVGGGALALGAGGDHPTAPPSPAPLAVGPSGPAPALTPTTPTQTSAPAIEGTSTMSSGTVEVTGVSSGAAAAQALAAAIQAATDEYVARLQAFQRQIAAMAEQAHGNVQLGTHSNVLANLAQAHEAAAAAMGQAAKVSGEVVPLMHAVRRSYLAIH